METNQPQKPTWLAAEPADIHATDMDEPLASVRVADHMPLSDTYMHAAKNASIDSSRQRAYRFASALLSMSLVSARRTSSFEPVFRDTRGGRSAAPVDFTSHVTVLAALADTTSNSVVRARAADLAWSLNRKDYKRSAQAVAAYEETLDAIAVGELRLRFDDDDTRCLSPEAHGLLYRALVVAAQSGRNPEIFPRLQARARNLFAQALNTANANAVLDYANICADFDAITPAELASQLESFARKQMAVLGVHGTSELLHAAASAYHEAQQPDAVSRVRLFESECFGEQASKENSAWSRAALLQDAIRALHNEKRTPWRDELQARLINEQRSMTNEFSRHTLQLDLREPIEQAIERVRAETLSDSLLAFALVYRSPSTDELVRGAIKEIQSFPMSVMIGKSFHDREGKVLFRTPGGADELTSTNPEVIAHLARSEGFRVTKVAHVLERARREIGMNFEISDIGVGRLLSQSPFVPRENLESLSVGLAHFLRGDMISAAYIVVPQFETVLRHIAHLLGAVTSTFDDADETQMERMLCGLLHLPALREYLPADLLDDIERLLAQRPGPNLRNELAHGLVGDSSARSFAVVYACWLMLHLCVLPLQAEAETT